MSLINGAEIIRAIDAELQVEYQPDAFVWIGKHYEKEWKEVVDRFNDALTMANETGYWEKARIEGELYKNTMVKLLRKYKAEKQIDDANAFLESLRGIA